MAETKKTTTTRRSTNKKTSINTKDVKSEVEEIDEKKVDVEVDVVKEKNMNKNVIEERVFSDRDLIPCTSVYPGTVGMTGRRTGNVYLWDEMGSVEYIEYQDLRSEVLNRNSSYIYDPLIIVNDDDFVRQTKGLTTLYNTFYSPDEIIENIKTLSPNEVRNFILELPVGIKDNVKNIVATMIQDGELDSVKKIKIIDKIFGTQLQLLAYE